LEQSRIVQAATSCVLVKTFGKPDNPAQLLGFKRDLDYNSPFNPHQHEIKNNVRTIDPQQRGRQ
jgi:hypothetical protein